MDEDISWVPWNNWEVVDNISVVSIGLIVRVATGVLLGLRENEPAKGEWFVPGGAVLKNERL